MYQYCEISTRKWYQKHTLKLIYCMHVQYKPIYHSNHNVSVQSPRMSSN